MVLWTEKGLELCPLACHIAVTNYTEIFKNKKMGSCYIVLLAWNLHQAGLQTEIFSMETRSFLP